MEGVNFCGVLFCGCFFLLELIFADRGQSAKSAKMRTRKIFMLPGKTFKETVINAYTEINLLYDKNVELLYGQRSRKTQVIEMNISRNQLQTGTCYIVV